MVFTTPPQLYGDYRVPAPLTPWSQQISSGPTTEFKLLAAQKAGKDFYSLNLKILPLTVSKLLNSFKSLKAAKTISLGCLAEELSKCTLPPHCSYNCGIDLLPQPTRGRLHFLMLSAPARGNEWKCSWGLREAFCPLTPAADRKRAKRGFDSWGM